MIYQQMGRKVAFHLGPPISTVDLLDVLGLSGKTYSQRRSENSPSDHSSFAFVFNF
jgi:hypothetical protein